MARRGTLVLLLAFALLARGLMEGVNGEGSYVRRRLAGHPLGASAVTVPALSCPTACGVEICCQNTWNPSVNSCTNSQTDYYNCGICGKSCASIVAPMNACCAGACTYTFTDANNCGGCGNKCLPSEECRFGLCGYTS